MTASHSSDFLVVSNHGSPNQRSIRPGRQDNYVKISRLGGGFVSDIFLTRKRSLFGFQRLRIIKELRPELAHTPIFVELFQREVRLTEQLKHPNIVHTFESHVEEAPYYFIREYLDGCTLEQLRLTERVSDRLPIEAQLEIIAEALSGLHYAHTYKDKKGEELEIIHRNVTARNIFISYDGQVKILGFGVAQTRENAGPTPAHLITGLIRHMSPEAVLGARIDKRADIFSVGMLLWEVATGQSMWEKDATDELIKRRVTQGLIPSPRTVFSEVPEELNQICIKALSYNPEHRYATALELQSDLDKYLESRNVPSRRHLGKLIRKQFAEHRKNTKKRIRDEIRKMSASSKTKAL